MEEVVVISGMQLSNSRLRVGMNDLFWAGCSKTLVGGESAPVGTSTDTLICSRGAESQPGWTLHVVVKTSLWKWCGAGISCLCNH